MGRSKKKYFFYNKVDNLRFSEEERPIKLEYRTEFYRDYARLIHSPSFRRLQGKTQLFPGNESDFFRNRLTHSLEVAQIGKAITRALNHKLYNRYGDAIGNFIDSDLVEFACLAHDLGHPPFGHQGEAKLDDLMKDYGGFEGNAQSLRLVSKLEKKFSESKDGHNCLFDNGQDLRKGLNLTLRSYASILKYDNRIPVPNKDRPKPNKLCKGYYDCDSDIVELLKGKYNIESGTKLRTIEMQIMDIADDIAYSTFDLEDSLKGDFINLVEFLNIDADLGKKISQAVFKKEDVSEEEVETIRNILFDLGSEILDVEVDFPQGYEQDEIEDEFINFGLLVTSVAFKRDKLIRDCGYYRTALTSKLLNEFINAVDIELNTDIPMLSEIIIRDVDIRLKIETIKRLTYEYQIKSNKLQVIEYRGKEIVDNIFNIIRDNDGRFLPFDFFSIFREIQASTLSPTKKTELEMRTICDFVSSMTDLYAVEFFSRLKSEKPQTIFKKLQ